MVDPGIPVDSIAQGIDHRPEIAICEVIDLGLTAQGILHLSMQHWAGVTFSLKQLHVGQ